MGIEVLGSREADLAMGDVTAGKRAFCGEVGRGGRDGTDFFCSFSSLVVSTASFPGSLDFRALRSSWKGLAFGLGFCTKKFHRRRTDDRNPSFLKVIFD